MPSHTTGLMRWTAISLASLAICLLATTALAGSGDQQVVLGDQNRANAGACKALSLLYGTTVYSSRPSTWSDGYRYWSIQQDETVSACTWYPKEAAQLTEGLDMIAHLNATIAVASGGHSSVVGASNIADGITIDLSKFSGVEVVPPENAGELPSIWLAPGARWEDVYAQLEPLGLTLSGGRVSDVGVGGYILGGGFSWFANQYGWTCDSVLEMQTLMPTGHYYHVDASHHENLFWALKGSLGAFGIVTKIRVPALLDRKVYGGALSYDQQHLDEVFHELELLGAMRPRDRVDTQGYASFGAMGNEKRVVNTVYLLNTTEAHAGHGTPSCAELATGPLIERFKRIPHIGSSLRSMTIRESAQEIGHSNTPGLRRSKFTLTSRCDAMAMRSVYESFVGVVNERHFRAEDVLGVTLQPITVAMQQKQQNIFGLDPEEGPLLLLSFELWWQHSADDDANESSMRKLHDAVSDDLERSGSLNRFLYPNYAARWQNPRLAFSEETQERLKQVKQRYDPDDVWRRMVPGIWHV